MTTIDPNDPKPASDSTLAANKSVADSLPFSNKDDFADASHGFLETWNPLEIKNEKERVIWTLDPYANQTPDAETPPTVNPSLWRQSRLNTTNGLFKVAEGFYQVRAFDMSNMTIIEGREGLIVIDPLISCECAKDALDLYRKNRKRPDARVKAVIYTHSHVDHFGGVCGIVDPKDVYDNKTVRVVAPAGFLEHAVSENVYAGAAMGRRAQYMYGPFLAPNVQGQVDAGLGKSQSVGRISIIRPTDEISRTGQTMELDGVNIVFHMTPGAEAPAEFDFYFPDHRVFCAAENATHTMHNIQTLRGARVRDALDWSKYLGEALELYGGKADVMFAQHHWPIWGQEKIAQFLAKQRDMYRYLNDQTLRMLNKGYTGIEIAEVFEMPPGLAQEWSCRGYYGTVNHNVKAVYDRYMGWFDGNPTNLHLLPASKSSAKYVELMGGAQKVYEAGNDAFKKGEYRWAAELLDKLICANVATKEMKQLQADTLEQLGYQAEAATWRNFYLMGAQELRNGIRKVTSQEASETDPSMFAAMSLDMIFDSLAARLKGPRAVDRIVINWRFTDTNEQYVVEVSNGALSYVANKQSSDANVTAILKRTTLDAILLKKLSFTEAINSGELVLTGSMRAFFQLFALQEKPDTEFPIVTPRKDAAKAWKGGWEHDDSIQIDPPVEEPELLAHPVMNERHSYLVQMPKGC